MTFAEELELARQETYAAQAAAREREYGRPLAATVRELLGVREQRDTEGLERRAAMWGAPQTGSSWGRGQAGLPQWPGNASFGPR